VETFNFEKGDKVAVAGGTIDSTGVINTQVTICTVVEVGQEDLLVQYDRVSSTPQVVSKTICTPIKFTAEDLMRSEILKPRLKDMVLFVGKLNWRDKDTSSIAGTVYEVKYREGRPHTVSIHTGTEMVDLPCENLLILQRNNSPKS